MPDDGARFPPLRSVPTLNPDLTTDGAERALLGALLMRPQLLDALPDTFSSAHYAYEENRDVHEAIVAVGRPGAPASVDVMKMLAVGNKARAGYIAELTASFVSLRDADVRGYAQTVTSYHQRRELVALSKEIHDGALAGDAEQPPDVTIAKAAARLDIISGAAQSGRPDVSLAQAADAAIAAGEAARAAGGRPSGLSTGFRSLDDAIGGLDPGALYICAGRPSMGKSSLGTQIALSVAQRGLGVCLVSLEMQAAQLGRRVLAIEAGVPLRTLIRGQWDVAQANQIVSARARMEGVKLTIAEQGGLNVQAIAIKARQAQRRHGLALLVVDHLHIVSAPAETTRMGATWAVGQVSKALKRIAKDMNVPVLALAQLNRGVESRDDKRPTMADLRQSGEIEEDAEAVMLMYRPEYYLSKAEPERNQGEGPDKWNIRVSEWRDARDRLAGKAEIIIPKVRDGESCTVTMRFDGARTCFEEIAQ